MEVTSITTVSAWICVETIHKSRLEFVLCDADDRQWHARRLANNPATYTDLLFEMLQKEFQNIYEINIDEMDVYGDVMFHLVADDFANLTKAIPRCNKVVQRWLNKYNIEKMKAE